MALQIRFYDNEESNWDNDMIAYHDQIGWFHVNDEPNRVAIQNRYASNAEQNQEYIHNFAARGNSYARFLNGLPAKFKTSMMGKGRPNNGIDDNLGELNTWIGRRNGQKVLLFDWDKTITVVEGMQFSGLTDAVDFEDMIEYVMGGRERFRRIQEMFQSCKQNGVAFFFITHNPNAKLGGNNRRIYLDIINRLVNQSAADNLDPDSLLYASGNFGFKKKAAANAALGGILVVSKAPSRAVSRASSPARASSRAASPSRANSRASSPARASSRAPSRASSPAKTVSRAPSRASSPARTISRTVSRATSPTQDYSKMKKDELIEECRRRGIACTTRTLKDDLIKSLTKKGGKRSTRKRSTRKRSTRKNLRN
jgi:hypothetical protein